MEVLEFVFVSYLRAVSNFVVGNNVVMYFFTRFPSKLLLFSKFLCNK